MDMVEAARSPEHHCKAGCNTLDRCACALLEDMADEIERLREALHDIAELRGALSVSQWVVQDYARSVLKQKDSE